MDVTEIGLRKIATFIEETHIEGGRAAERPITTVVVAAIVRNTWAGKGFVEDLRPEILRLAPVLGREMTKRLVAIRVAVAPKSSKGSAS